MGILSGALGGMGDALVNIGATNMKSELARENESALNEQRSKLDANKQMALDAYKRSSNLKAAQEIDAAAGKITKDRLGKQIDSLNDPELGKLSPEDKELLANATPAQQKEVGILGGSRAQKYDDRAAAAESLGYMDHAKEARSQQDIELRRTAEENRDAHNMRRDVNADERAKNTDAYNNKHLDEIIRHNKELESAALARTGAERLSPAAKVQLEIAGTSLGSAQKQESLAAKELTDAQRTGNPEAIDAARRDWSTAKNGVKMAMDHYTQVGKAHLGAEWKEIADSDTPAKPSNTWDSTTGEVVSNGRVIGKATSAVDAQALIAKLKTQPTSNPTDAAPAAIPKPAVNEAGYYDVQNTIDGAKRGDKKALAFLQTLIDSGETTPAQRQQIAKITGQK